MESYQLIKSDNIYLEYIFEATSYEDLIYRYALVESDVLPPEQQNAIIRKLELPVAALVHSGGKSLHAERPLYQSHRHSCHI